MLLLHLVNNWLYNSLLYKGASLRGGSFFVGGCNSINRPCQPMCTGTTGLPSVPQFVTFGGDTYPRCRLFYAWVLLLLRQFCSGGNTLPCYGIMWKRCLLLPNVTSRCFVFSSDYRRKLLILPHENRSESARYHQG